MSKKLLLGTLLGILFIVFSGAGFGLITFHAIFNDTRPEENAAIAFGDVNNDGDLDLFIASKDNYSPIYENNGTAVTKNRIFYQNISNSRRAIFVDVDGDGDLDLAVGANRGKAVIYENNGTTITNKSLFDSSPIRGSEAIAFGDVDNDGDLDLAVMNDSIGIIIYENNGTAITHNVLSKLTNFTTFMGAITFGDVDNDGDLDLLLVRYPSLPDTTSTLIVFENNGTGITSHIAFQTNLLSSDTVSLADVDNDGDLDVAIGATGTSNVVILENNGAGLTSKIKSYMPDGRYTTDRIAFGDVDNDGDLDMGVSNTRYAAVYQNNGTDITTTVLFNDTGFGHYDTNDVAFADVDNDGDLDFAVMKRDWGPTVIFDNEMISPYQWSNNVPNPPTILGSVVIPFANAVNLSWNDGSDAETPQQALFYNVRVGTCSGCNDIVTGVYGTNAESGYWGNGRQVNFRFLRNLKPGTYYWSVQSIDNEHAKSAWSAEQKFVVNGIITTSSLNTTLHVGNISTINMTRVPVYLG